MYDDLRRALIKNISPNTEDARTSDRFNEIKVKFIYAKSK